jgi:HEAT repeat protein
LLASERLEDRIEAAWAVGQLDSREDEGALLEFLNSDSERLRLVSIESLRVVGGEATRSLLGEAIPRHTGKTQEALLRLTMERKAAPALRSVRAVAEDPAAALPFRLLALDAIAAMADAEAKPLLLRILAGKNPSDASLRAHAARAWGSIGGPEAMASIKPLAMEKVIPMPMLGPSYDADESRIACIQVLEKLNPDALKGFLNHPALEDCSEKIRIALAEALSVSTGKPYDYRRDVSFRSHFIESLEPEEYPRDLAENIKRPPVFSR